MKIKKYYIKDINEKIFSRKIVLFGAGDIAQKTHKILDNFNVSHVVDNANNLINSKDKKINLDIKSPNSLVKKKSKFFIVICTTSYREVAEQLIQLDYKIEKDFIVSPILNDLNIIDELENINKKLIFSSGAPSLKDKKFGGGIYFLEIFADKWSYTKKIDGNCYGIIKFNDNFVGIDQKLGIFEFDHDFKILRSKKLPSSSRPHGVSFSKKYNQFFVACSYLDSILILDKNFKVVKEIKISKKAINSNSAIHHINDCLYSNDSLYVSMFSETGNWKQDVYDGCICEINLKTKTVEKPILRNLWMPHNPKLVNGNFYVNDSLRGNLLGNNFNEIANFKGFTRGLAHDGRFFYVGQSKNRNFSRNIGVSNNISIDTGIVVYDELNKISRFLQLSPKLSEIHAIEIFN